jgi:nucleotide-binding universal stress UspA family protein
MFNTLLVPLDGTPQSNAALPFARVLAQKSGARLLLVRVVDPSVLSPDERQSQPPQLLEQLKRIAEELRVSTGEVLTEILQTVDVEHADALILATHAGALERLLDTSTARRLIARSRMPVFVLRPGGRRVVEFQTLLVAVDGSPGAAQALDEAISLARLTGAAIVPVRVIPKPEHFGFDPLLATTLGARPDEGADAHALAVAEQYVNEVARKLRAHGLTASPKVMVGAPAERIVAAADEVDADVIVMSTRAYLEPLRSLIGSTADEVVQTARRPVLLVRRTDGVAASGRQTPGTVAYQPL